MTFCAFMQHLSNDNQVHLRIDLKKLFLINFAPNSPDVFWDADGGGETSLWYPICLHLPHTHTVSVDAIGPERAEHVLKQQCPGESGCMGAPAHPPSEP